MVSHVVLFSPRSNLSAAEREGLIAAFERAVRSIPTVGRVRVGRRVKHGAGYEAHSVDAADYLVALDFDDLAGLQAYLNHPEHAELGARFNESLRSALIYDFEVGALDSLAAML